MAANPSPSESTARTETPANDGSSQGGREDLNARWETERADPAWTAGTREYLSSALQDAHVPADRVQAVDCRASLCKIDVAFQSHEEATKLGDLRDPDSELRAFPVAGVPDAYSVFMARAGAALPLPQPNAEGASAAAMPATEPEGVQQPTPTAAIIVDARDGRLGKVSLGDTAKPTAPPSDTSEGAVAPKAPTPH
jgi:hypothetical protein